MDYYQILGVKRDAPAREIKEAYRKLALQYHPDRNRGNPAAVEKMKEINEAYAVLSDPQKKREYDRLQEQYGTFGYDRFKRTYSEQDIFRGSDIDQIFEEMARAFGFRGFEEVFRESYGEGYRAFEFRRPGFFARGFVFFGPAFRKTRPVSARDNSRSLSGYSGKFFHYLLKKLLGAGEPRRGKDWHDIVTISPRLAQEGGKMPYHHWRKSKDLLVTIPSGISAEQRIRLKGMGAEGKNGGEPGDLYLRIRIRRVLLQKIRDLLKI